MEGTPPVPSSRFHDGHSGATHLVRIAVRDNALILLDEDGVQRAAWPVGQVRAAPELDPDGVVRLTARGHLGVLMVDDAGERETLRRAGLRLPRARHMTGWSWVRLAGGAATVLALGVVLLNTAPGWIAPRIPAAWERQLAVPTETLLLRSAARCDGAEGQAALERLVARLRTAGGIALPIEITVLDNRMVNAFTLPGGKVVVMRGLIAAAGDGAELAGVLGHELGHVAHHDSTAMLLRGLGLSILLRALGLGDAAGALAEGAGNLLTLAYGRAAETAADDHAISVLTAAGLRADGLSRFFGHMERKAAGKDKEVNDLDHRYGEAQEDARSAPALEWLSTHPASDARRERTARAAVGGEPFTAAEWKAVRGMCGGRK